MSKKSTIELHIKSVKHTKGKERLILKNKRQLDIVASLRAYDKEVQSSGETLPDTTRVYRVNDVTALLKAGIHLSKLDILRDVLEENAYSLSDSSHLRRLIPFILQNEVKNIKKDIAGEMWQLYFMVSPTSAKRLSLLYVISIVSGSSSSVCVDLCF